MTENLLKAFTINLLNSKGIGNKTFFQLLELFGGIEQLYNFEESLEVLHELNEKLVLILKNSKQDLNAEQNFEGMKFIWEDDFPNLLKQITDPPICLFFEGVWPSQNAFENTIGVVGTRRASSYGQRVTRYLTKQLVENGLTIVSGMADGVDSIAHLECINSSGFTIAVLGTPIKDSKFGRAAKISKEILAAGGLIVSEYSPTTTVVPGMFARRNRIIAGLSKGILVTEAGEDSGSLITARIAIEYDREVFAVPGNIDSTLSAGTNSLIKNLQGRLISDAKDIISEYDVSIVKSLKNLNMVLSEVEEKIVSILNSKEKSVDEIVQNSGINRLDILKTVMNLEMKNVVLRDSISGKYQLK